MNNINQKIRLTISIFFIIFIVSACDQNTYKRDVTRKNNIDNV